MRVAIIGTSGSGKTTLARHVAARLDVPHLELDSVFHQPGWQPLPADDFRALVAEFCAQDAWVTCGKYAVVRDLLLERAEVIVCLDHHRLRQALRVARRSWGRFLRREVLWNGNREPWRALFPFGDPERAIIRWAWQGVPRVRRLFDQLEATPPHPGAQVVRLRGWRAVDAWVASLPTT